MILMKEHQWSKVCSPRLLAVLAALIAVLFAGVGNARACDEPGKSASRRPCHGSSTKTRATGSKP